MAFLITGSNHVTTGWQAKDMMNELVIGLNERLLASKNQTLYPALGSSQHFDKKDVYGYAGKIYQCTETHDTDSIGTFEPAKWQEMRVLVGSDIQGISYGPSGGAYDLDWWGWSLLQSKINTMSSDFVKEIHLTAWSAAHPGDPILNYIEMYTWDKLRAAVNAVDGSLFDNGAGGVASDWTRTYPAGSSVGTIQAGDYISYTLIGEIRECLNLLRKTLLDFDINDNYAHYDDSFESANSVCATARAAVASDWTSNFPTSDATATPIYEVTGEGFNWNPPAFPRYTWRYTYNDTRPSLAGIPEIDSVGFDWDIYGVSDDSNETFTVPPSVVTAAIPIASFTAVDQCRTCRNGTEAAMTTTFDAADFIGLGAGATFPLDDYNILCADISVGNTNVQKGFNILYPEWVMGWDFTN